MANYTKTTIGKENRIELHEKLSLTGAEISLNGHTIAKKMETADFA